MRNQGAFFIKIILFYLFVSNNCAYICGNKTNLKQSIMKNVKKTKVYEYCGFKFQCAIELKDENTVNPLHIHGRLGLDSYKRVRLYSYSVDLIETDDLKLSKVYYAYAATLNSLHKEIQREIEEWAEFHNEKAEDKVLSIFE